MISLKVKKIANNWYPEIEHKTGYMLGFNSETNRYLNFIDKNDYKELYVTMYSCSLFLNLPDSILILNKHDLKQDCETEIDYDNSGEYTYDIDLLINNKKFSINRDLLYILEKSLNLDFDLTYQIYIT